GLARAAYAAVRRSPPAPRATPGTRPRQRAGGPPSSSVWCSQGLLVVRLRMQALIEDAGRVAKGANFLDRATSFALHLRLSVIRRRFSQVRPDGHRGCRDRCEACFRPYSKPAMVSLAQGLLVVFDGPAGPILSACR